ncbi:MAG: hypothetical protein ACXIUM_06395 [Wenzhouxiangella sp.]
MRWHSKVVGILIIVSLGLLITPSLAQAQSAQVVSVDSNEIIAATDRMLLRHDLASGRLVISFTSGERLEFEIQPLMVPEQALSAPVLNFHSGGQFFGRTSDEQIQSGCQAEANTLQAAINGVQAACGNGNSGSTSCGAAISFYHSASSAYAGCIRQFEQMR